VVEAITRRTERGAVRQELLGRPIRPSFQAMSNVLDTEPLDEDDRLVALYAAGDGAAPRILTARFLPLAFRLAMRMLANRAEAEDVAQEAMLRLFRAAPGWRPGQAKLSTWHYRVTANLCTDRLRKRPMLPLDEAAEVADGAPSAEQGLTQAARHAALARALDGLPERQRTAVVLRHIEGLQNPEIAEIMGVGVEAVESLVARGKRGLTAVLADQRAALGYDHDG